MYASSIRKFKKSASLRERIRESLSDAIISGELAPGTMVTVPVLAAEFDVSATPVREAILDLEQRGFVYSVANKGFRVTEVGEQDLREILELRQLLEAPIVADLVGQISAEQMPKWRKIADSIIEYAEAGDLAGFLEADRRFHLDLLALHGNGRLVSLVKELRVQTRMVGLAHKTESPELSKSAQEHHGILDLIEHGDRAELESLMQSHIAHILSWWGPGEADASA